MEENLIEIATRIFGLNDGEVTMGSTYENTKNLDSLRHMRLILEIEDRFDFEMDEAEITGVVDIKSLATIIAKYQG
jgi:acyl carrier protein